MEFLNLIHKALMETAIDSWPTLIALAVGILIPWIYMTFRTPPPNRCGTRHGPPITAPRIRLRDGRYMAYKERGVPREKARYKAMYTHPFGGSRNSIDAFPQGVLEELGVYMVSFDRPGYGESDPFPQRTVKSEAGDMEELADQLQLGEKFYLLGLSMGGYPEWSCIKYIPHRLAGVALMAPALNYWWPGVDTEISKKALDAQSLGDRLSFIIAHYAPSLLYLWSKQTCIPSALSGRFDESKMNKSDREIFEMWKSPDIHKDNTATQQGTAESLIRDFQVQFGTWDFFPGTLPDKKVPVYVFEGAEDCLVNPDMQRSVCERLPWVKYHEIPGAGHFLDYTPGVFESVLKALLA